MTSDPYEIVVLLEDCEEKAVDYDRELKLLRQSLPVDLSQARQVFIRNLEAFADMLEAWVRLERARHR